ncbi:ATPase involved in DNA repair protein, putative [Babesia ovata]|uniref:ATPase involved in DNA repair protein, putative n=1 Tax=Babesia ovata TaxID=189622 RepID=A0A2H6KI10_9APIC|nr:ATPase involved in DNA repair protein, putative [Babesia ovata]GBE62628.1 ATPase involved in DNA repair protein, putative [Babesia ovata]
MKSARCCGRRNLAYVLCIYMIAINGVLARVPGGGKSSGSGAPPATGIAFYASNAEFYRRVKVLESLTCYSTELDYDLSRLRYDISQSDASIEIKEADTKECDQLIRDVKLLISASVNYTELRKLLNEYRAIARGLQREHITQERLAELNTDLTNLEQVFEVKKRFASDILRVDNAPSYRETVIRAKRFIRKHKVQPSPQSHDQRPSGERGVNLPASEKDLVGNIGQDTEGESIPESEEGNEMMQDLLNDRSFFKRFYAVQAKAAKIGGIVHDPLIDDANLDAADRLSSANDDVIPDDIQYQYDTSYDNMIDIRNAWDIYKRYNDISDALKKMDPTYPQAIEFVKEQRELESEFEEYAFFLRTKSLWDLDQELTYLLFKLEMYTGSRENGEPKQSGNKPSRQCKCGMVGNIRDTKNTRVSSGFVKMEITIIRTVVAAGLIAAF